MKENKWYKLEYGKYEYYIQFSYLVENRKYIKNFYFVSDKTSGITTIHKVYENNHVSQNNLIEL